MMGALSPAALFLQEHQAKKTSASALSAVQVPRALLVC